MNQWKNPDELKIAFDQYVSQFDHTDPRIEQKYIHSFQVMGLSRSIMTRLQGSEDDKNLACLIGLLHDIGRFNQLTQANSYNDQLGFDHGDEGYRLLIEENLLRAFINTKKYDKIIGNAVKFHNKFEIGDVNKESLRFCKIIRDADKIDIMRSVLKRFVPDTDNTTLNETYVSDFYHHRCSKKSATEVGPQDTILFMTNFLFDIHEVESFQIIQKLNLIDQMFSKFTKKTPQINEIQSLANQYIQERIEKNAK